MRSSVIAVAVLMAAILTAGIHAQEEVPIRVWLDANAYAYLGHDSVSYVEFCTAIQRADIQFEEIEGGYVGKTFSYLEIMDEGGTVLDSLGKYVPVPVQFLEEAYREHVRIFDCMGAALKPGKYQLRLTVVDMNTKRSGVATSDIDVRSFSGDKLVMSDLELAYQIEAVKSDSVYSSLIKADRKVIPNPNGYFSNDDSVMYFYTEAYNLSTDESKDDEFEIEIQMTDRYGYNLKEYPKIKHQKPGRSAVITEAVPLAGLPGGEYILAVRVKDMGTGREAATRERVNIIYSFDQLSPTMTDPDSFTEEDGELMEKVIYFISSKNEKETYKTLNLDGKKNFLIRFWADRNPAPGSPVNKFKNEIFRRFLYANHQFSTSMVNREDGWKTDRGRVYITYGEPDEIERNPSAMGTKPYQKWYYDRLPGQSGGDYFVFVDQDGYGNYRLVHSTLRGEISNPDWENRLNQVGP